MAWSEDVPARFDAYGWHTQRVADGNDVEAISAAIDAALADDRPSLIAVRTHIGFGSPNKQDSQKAHGAPLGPDEVRLTKEAYGWDPDRTFYVPDEAAAIFRAAIPAGEALVAEWEARFEAYARRASRRGRRVPATDGPDARRRLGCGPQDVRDRLRGRDAQRQPGGDPVARGARAGAVRRGGGPVRVEPDRRQGRRRLQRRDGRAEPSLRRARARDGRDRQRARVSRRVHPVCRHVPDLQRLHARVGAARVAVRAARDLRLDARLGRPRRGRADPPAGRALRGAPGDPEPVVRAAWRCERDGGRVGAGGRADRRSGRAGVDPPEAADAARDAIPGHGPGSPGAGTSCARRAAGRRS